MDSYLIINNNLMLTIDASIVNINLFTITPKDFILC